MKNIFLLVVSLLGIVTIAQAGDPIPSVNNNSILLRVDWEFCEPTEKNYDWQFIDGQVESARKRGKKIALLIDATTGLPEWLRDQKTGTLPINKINALQLTSWTRFIQKMGERYQQEATIEKVYITQMMPEAAQQADTRLREIIYAWMKVVDAFEAAFPQQQLVNAGGWQEDVHVATLLDAYASKKIGSRYQTIVASQPYTAPLLQEKNQINFQPCDRKPVEIVPANNEPPTAVASEKARQQAIKATAEKTDASDAKENSFEKLISNLIVLGKPSFLTILQ